MRKLSIIVFVVFSLLLSGMTQAAKMDITAAGDPVVGIPDNGRWPAGEAPPLVIDDNVNTKYLHFFDGPFIITGFSVTPKYGGLIVTEITFTTANDAPERDPTTFELYGSNDSINGPWELIASGDVVDFALPDPWPRFTKNETPITFENAMAYAHYQVLITAVRDLSQECCMQVAEVELLATLPPVPAGWAYKDIGTTGGSAWESNGSVNIRADGHDIWGNADGIGFLFRPVSGECTLEVELTQMENTHYWAKAGPAIRETLAPGSRHGTMACTRGQQGLQLVYRPSPDGGSGEAGWRDGENIPLKLRITRDETIDGTYLIGHWFDQPLPGLWKWVELGRALVPMGDDAYIGLAVCSTSPGVLNHCIFENLTLTADPYCKPWYMLPEDGAIDQPLTPTLTWMPGDGAAQHEVYMGTDPAAMSLVATKDVGDESYTPDPPLQVNTKYYWQIVEKPDDCAGPVYSFTTYYEPPWWTGTILRELWTSIWWTEVRHLTDSARYILEPPAQSDLLTVMDSPDIGWSDYGGRMTAHLIPGTSGDYTFWIAADDGTELWLSTDTICNPVKIAYWGGWTGYHAYDWYAEQKSAPISLVGGQKYLIQSFWKEGGGGDHCSVAWQGPDAPSRVEISGDYLSRAFAINPKPGIKENVTSLDAKTLKWTPGVYATQQELYHGTDPGAMALIATLPADATSYPAPAAAFDTTYYWQVNCTDGTEVWEGDIWSYSVSEWDNRDIGRHDPAGSASYDAGTGTHVINADGGDIWGEWDEFHYVYTTPTFTRDIGTIVARVVSLQNSNEWAKAGVMIRQSLAANSKTTNMLTTPEESPGGGRQRATFQWRDCDGCGSGSSHHEGVLNPEWVKLERNGNTFRGYHSDDGINWCYHGDRYVEMSSDIYVGLAVTSHAGGVMTTAVIDNVSITTPDPRQAWGLDPPNGATDLDIHTTLRWNAGDDCTQHLVYFSEDEDAVVNRTVEPTILPVETTELYVGPLDLTKTYYWCVDEVYNPVMPGEVISFTVENYRLLEDFESYDIPPEALPPQVMTPGEILVEAVPPPEQAWVDPVTLVDAIDPGTDCLLSRWDFEGDYTDSVSGYDGTAEGDATIVTDAERGNVLSLDGDGDLVDCGNPDALNFGTNDWSVSVWIKTTVSNKGTPFSNGGDDSGGIRYTLGVGEHGSNLITLTTDDNSAKRQADSITVVTDNVWHHVLGVREGSNIKIYVDGKLEETVGVPAGYDLSGTSQANVRIGAIWHQKSSYIYKYYTGLIDDVRVYNCALSLENARFLAEIGPLLKPGYYGPCIAHYDFDEGSGSTAIDSSGNGLDGVISGAEYTTTTTDGSASCLDFGGDGDNVLNEDAGPYLNNLSAISISLWVQSDLTDTDKGFFMGGDTASDRWGMRYDAAGGSGGGTPNVIKYGVNSTTGNEEDESSEGLQTTEWQHIVMTWQSGVGLMLYINGVPDIPSFKDTVESGVLTNYTKILVGKGSKDGAADAGWDGRIDDVRVYDYALSENEARYLAGVGDLALPDRYAPMLLHLKFDGDATDSSGNNYHGTVYSEDGGPDYVAGIYDQAIQLQRDYVEVGSVGISGSLPRTIAGWVKADTLAIPDWTNVFGFSSTPGGGCDLSFDMNRRGGQNQYCMHVYCWESNIMEIDLDWHHLAGSYDGGTIRWYGDGIFIGSVGRGLNTQDNMMVGKRGHTDNRFPGCVDDVRVYDYALDLGQIRTLAAYTPVPDIKDTWSGRAAAAPALEWRTPGHESSQSMRVEYTGSGAVTRLVPFDDGKHPHGWNADFSLGQAQAMSLFFKGHPGNAPGAMFAQLTTVVPSGHTQRVVYDGDPEDLMKPVWQEWTMSLKALSTGKPFDPPLEEGLPITKIKDFGVGIIGAGGGVLYFDDFRLYPVRCVPKYGPVYDVTDDCAVDRKDMAVIANAWLAQEGGNGLWYEYFELAEGEPTWSVLPDFRNMPVTTQGTVDNFDIGVRLRDDDFGFLFTGIVVAPVGGDYTFYINSDDGSKLYIDSGLVVDYDGLHGMGGPISGTINLMAGEHLIEVTQFERGGGEGLTVEVEGPGIPRVPIPNEVLFIPPGIPVDFNGDGIVNFKDYADLLNHFGDEALFPAPEDQL